MSVRVLYVMGKQSPLFGKASAGANAARIWNFLHDEKKLLCVNRKLLLRSITVKEDDSQINNDITMYV